MFFLKKKIECTHNKCNRIKGKKTWSTHRTRQAHAALKGGGQKKGGQKKGVVNLSALDSLNEIIDDVTELLALACIRQHTSAYVSIRQHTKQLCDRRSRAACACLYADIFRVRGHIYRHIRAHMAV